jgi:hypothetical protein
MTFSFDHWSEGGKAGHRVVSLGTLLFWKPKTELQDDDLVCFYDADYSNVLEIDDPAVVDVLAQQDGSKKSC